jgi:hypothetical protein
MKTKRLYQAPLTERVLVELEGGFCASITFDGEKMDGVNSTAQEYKEFDASIESENPFSSNQDGSIKWE